MIAPFPRSWYVFFFSCIAVVVVAGLFVPLMDNDAAHHANIALRMYLTGDYVTLADHAGEYLDKPHFHFWLSAMSYHIFGVTSFAYKFPSLLFSVLACYSTYRLGKLFYGKESGRLASLILATSFGFLLSNSDVRMDAILTGCIIFSAWQLIESVKSNKFIYILGAAAGLAAGFATKGHIGIITPGIAFLFFIGKEKKWSWFIKWKFPVCVFLFLLFIAPVVYCYYLQFDLHPEKVVRGRTGVSGVQFILWGQSIERFEGESFGGSGKKDYLFFIHSFLWSFAPWSIACYFAIVHRIIKWKTIKLEWASLGTFLTLLLIITLAGFKLPHYINIILPFTSVLLAGWLIHFGNVYEKKILVIQKIISFLITVLALMLVTVFFPAPYYLFLVLVFPLVVTYYFLLNKTIPAFTRAIAGSAMALITSFFLLNIRFYPSLLKYQAGNELAGTILKKINTERLYFSNGIYSSSLNFYTKSLHKNLPEKLPSGTSWVVCSNDQLMEISRALQVKKVYSSNDYEITRLKLNFLLPHSRDSVITKLNIAEVYSP